MTVQVEDYFVEEATELLYDEQANDEWKQIATDLGLEGQKSLIGKNESPIPFLAMSKEQCSVYTVLLPQRQSVEKYSGSTIPLRVMRNVSLAKNADYFKSLEVWYNEREPDPILVGTSHDGKLYIVNRWGEVLDSWPELVKRAASKVSAILRAKLEKSKAEAEQSISQIESLAELFLTKGQLSFNSLPTIYEWDVR